MKHQGSCLCGKIQFQVSAEINTIYHCHCSLCRKQSGTDSNGATLIARKYFKWLCGEEHIQQFEKASGFRVHFCRSCGSAVPNRVGQQPWMWIPLGLIDTPIYIQKRLGFCMQSSANWSYEKVLDQQYGQLPHGEELKQLFQLDD